MSENTLHQMNLTDDSKEGTEEWTCPVCGKLILIEWNPWRKITIVEGDKYAFHSASKGGLKIAEITVD